MKNKAITIAFIILSFLNVNGQKILRSSIRCLSSTNITNNHYVLSYSNISNPILLNKDKTLYQTTPFVFLENRQENTQPKLIVYPNPSSRYFNILTNISDFNYKITDLSGRLILSGHLKNIDMESFSKGIYCLNVYSKEEFVTTNKIILQ